MAINQSNRLMLVSALAALSATAHGAFTGLSYTASQPFGLDSSSWRLYADFSAPEDHVVGVFAAYGESVDGSFYQNPFGSWTEPNPTLALFFPDLAHDTFVTIGQLTAQPGVAATTIERGSIFGSETFEASWSTAQDGPHAHGPTVLLGQFTFEDSWLPYLGIELVIEWVDGVGDTHFSQGTVCLGPLSGAFCQLPSEADLNGDCVVNGLDLAILLGLWGTECGFPKCPGELAGGSPINGLDLAELLSNWGPLPVCLPAR